MEYQIIDLCVLNIDVYYFVFGNEFRFYSKLFKNFFINTKMQYSITQGKKYNYYVEYYLLCRSKHKICSMKINFAVCMPSK